MAGARRRRLTAALAARGLELRADSHLCREYVERGAGAVAAIVGSMEEMQVFHTGTRYAAVHRGLREQLEAEHEAMCADAEAACAHEVGEHEAIGTTSPGR